MESEPSLFSPEELPLPEVPEDTFLLPEALPRPPQPSLRTVLFVVGLPLLLLLLSIGRVYLALPTHAPFFVPVRYQPPVVPFDATLLPALFQAEDLHWPKGTGYQIYQEELACNFVNRPRNVGFAALGGARAEKWGTIGRWVYLKPRTYLSPPLWTESLYTLKQTVCRFATAVQARQFFDKQVKDIRDDHPRLAEPEESDFGVLLWQACHPQLLPGNQSVTQCYWMMQDKAFVSVASVALDGRHIHFSDWTNLKRILPDRFTAFVAQQSPSPE